jgi:putative flavoprotein involved in K+ transport
MRVHGRYEVAVIGGGQAGLAMSYCLGRRGIDHIVIEKHRVGHDWRTRRWDSFCLVTPNWQCALPGFPYAGDDPYGFMVKDEIIRYLEDYAARFRPPLVEGVAVTAVRTAARGFALDTTDGSCSASCTAENVVLAVGGYHEPDVPRIAERLPASLTSLHSADYRNADQLPAGGVLVVGTGQSGCQIAEDLHLAGRRVHLAVGSAPRVARRYRGKDVVEWLDMMGHYRLPVDEHPLGDRVRDKTNHYVTGRAGGHDIDLRQFAREGMQLHGRLIGVRGSVVEFAGDLAANLDAADATSERIKDGIDKYIAAQRIDAPSEPRYQPVWTPGAHQPRLDLVAAGMTSVIWCTGFRANWRWVEVPIFDGAGYPRNVRGVTAVDGLYVLGLPWLHTWGSGRLSGVGDDASYLADRIAARTSGVERSPATRDDRSHAPV